MFVYLEGDPIKGVVASHHVTVNPGAHLGVDKVVSTLVEKDGDGKRAGRVFHVHFVNGTADADPDALGQYLLDQGMALAEPWRAPDGAPAVANDPAWRWREGRI